MKIHGKKQIMLAALAMMISQHSAHAALIAILDSGSDLSHPDLVKKAWNNPLDDSSLGYPGDVHGWNFLNNSSQLVDLTQVDQFSPDVYEYFNVQARLMDGTDDKITNPEGRKKDIQWYKQHKTKAFLAQLNAFGDFAHGTNVAGIAAKDSDQAILMGITEIGTPVKGAENDTHQYLPSSPDETKVQKFLDRIAGNPIANPDSTDSKIGQLLNRHKVKVANCSFGNSKAKLLKIVKAIEFFKKPFHNKKDTIASYDYVMNHIMLTNHELIDSSPSTLFVIAAGNDGSDNDKYFTTPANIKTDNTIAVAATVGHKKLASFSNYGATTVEVAAPGVGILSDSPGGKQVRMTGTSQATPYVTNIAGKILDANPKLTTAQVKQILMGTVDVKDYLQGKVVSSGIVNGDRASRAASLSNSMTLARAITQANAEIADLTDPANMPDDMEDFADVAPLKSEFEL